MFPACKPSVSMPPGRCFDDPPSERIEADRGKYASFHLVLVVTQNCNLSCDYCYMGRKRAVSMPLETAKEAISRSLVSLSPLGVLDLGFFGGEPLLEAGRILDLMKFARCATERYGQAVRFGVTTNGTVESEEAWQVMTSPEVDLAISCDGLPEVHDLHRRTPAGERTYGRVERTLKRLNALEKTFRVVSVVSPDTVSRLPDGVEHLVSLGITELDLSLNVWAKWTEGEMGALEQAIARTARLWGCRLPSLSVNWFDEKLATLMGVPLTQSARCRFGAGEIAVAPSGRLYPCERLVGEDSPSNPMVLSSSSYRAGSFVPVGAVVGSTCETCRCCAALDMCNTFCRCSNYVRTGNTETPDRFLCLFNKFCMRETARVLKELAEKSKTERIQGGNGNGNGRTQTLRTRRSKSGREG